MRLTAALSLFLVTSVASPVEAQAAREPTKTDLRAAYCEAVIKAQIRSIQSIPAPNTTSLKDRYLSDADAHEEKDTLARLFVYINPEEPSLDGEAISQAARRGEIDQAAVRAAMYRILTPCAHRSDIVSCVERRERADPLLQRVRSCQDPRWLPF